MDIKFSFYNYIFEYHAKKYLYNILSTSLIEIDENLMKAVKNNDVSQIPQEYVQAMIDEGFLVDKNMDESLSYKFYYDHVRFFERADSLELTLIPSYNCNLACPYCVQGHSKSSKKMSVHEAEAVIRFIKNKILGSEVQIKRMGISLYGGEPMLSKKELQYLCSEINKLAKKHDIKMFYSMVSNLTLLDEDMINMIKENQISVQVSIDGVKPEHDKRRIYKNGKGTFDVILNNLKKLCNAGLKHLITIRLNTDKNNISNAEETFNNVKEYSDDIYFSFLREYADFNTNYRNDCVSIEDYSNNETKVFNEILRKNNRKVYPGIGKKSPCAMNAENKFFIDTYLNVYKCDMLLNQPECRVGTLDLDGNFHREAQFFQQMAFSPFEFEKCRKCKFLPICGAGCPAQKYGDKNKKDGKLLEPECKYNESILLTYLKGYVDRHEEE